MPAIFEIVVVTEDDKFKVVVEKDNPSLINDATDEAVKAIAAKTGKEIAEVAVKKVSVSNKALVVIADGMKPQFLGFED